MASTSIFAAARSRSACASAELVVPRSMPTTYRLMTPRGSFARALAHVVLELPLARAVLLDAVQLERADLGDARAQVDRDQVAGVGRLLVAHHRRDRRQLGERFVDLLDQRADAIVAPRGRRQKAELRRLADDQAELARLQLGFGALLHAERRDAQRL